MAEKGIARHMSPWLSWDNMPGSDSGSHECGWIVEFLSRGLDIQWHTALRWQGGNLNELRMKGFEQFIPWYQWIPDWNGKSYWCDRGIAANRIALPTSKPKNDKELCWLQSLPTQSNIYTLRSHETSNEDLVIHITFLEKLLMLTFP